MIRRKSQVDRTPEACIHHRTENQPKDSRCHGVAAAFHEIPYQPKKEHQPDIKKACVHRISPYDAYHRHHGEKNFFRYQNNAAHQRNNRSPEKEHHRTGHYPPRQNHPEQIGRIYK